MGTVRYLTLSASFSNVRLISMAEIRLVGGLSGRSSCGPNEPQRMKEIFKACGKIVYYVLFVRVLTVSSSKEIPIAGESVRRSRALGELISSQERARPHPLALRSRDARLSLYCILHFCAGHRCDR